MANQRELDMLAGYPRIDLDEWYRNGDRKVPSADAIEAAIWLNKSENAAAKAAMKDGNGNFSKALMLQIAGGAPITTPAPDTASQAPAASPAPVNYKDVKLAETQDEAYKGLTLPGTALFANGNAINWAEIVGVATTGINPGNKKLASKEEVAAAKWIMNKDKEYGGWISSKIGQGNFTKEELFSAVVLAPYPSPTPVGAAAGPSPTPVGAGAAGGPTPLPTGANFGSIKALTAEETLRNLDLARTVLFANGTDNWTDINSIGSTGKMPGTNGRDASPSEVVACKWLAEKNANGAISSVIGHEPFTLQELENAIRTFEVPPATDSDDAVSKFGKTHNALFSGGGSGNMDDIKEIASTGKRSNVLASSDEISACKWLVNNFKDKTDRLERFKGTFSQADLTSAMADYKRVDAAPANTTAAQTFPAMFTRTALYADNGMWANWANIVQVAQTGKTEGRNASAAEIAGAKYIVSVNARTNGAVANGVNALHGGPFKGDDLQRAVEFAARSLA